MALRHSITPFHYATRHGNVEIVQPLVHTNQHAALIESNFHQNALEVAAIYAHFEVIVGFLKVLSTFKNKQQYLADADANEPQYLGTLRVPVFGVLR